MAPTPVVARPWRSLERDAFYLDEEDTDLNSSTQCPLNKFLSLRQFLIAENPLDASIAASITGRPATLIRPERIRKKVRSNLPNGDPPPFHLIFASRKLRDHPPAVVKVSLFFCVGLEMNLHGLHHFFEDSPDRVLITVSGREALWVTPAAAWAIGITSQQIDGLFKATGLTNQKWQVEIMAGYSTGYRGVNGTINNRLIPLDKLKTVILYDALYSGSQPAPGGNTAKMLRSMAAAGAKIVVYEVTSGGTPRTKAPPHDLSVVLPPETIAVDLKKKKGALWSLLFARVLQKGVKDRYVKPAEVPAAVQTLIKNGLPARGTLASSTVRQSAATSGTLDDWAKLPANEPAVATIASSLVNKVYPIIRDRRLMAWPMPDAGGISHAGFIPEFAWEFLARDP